MKDVRADVFASLVLVGTALLSASAWSMDELTDGQLASTTGQDGLTVMVALPSNTLNVDQVAIFDSNALPSQIAGQTSPGVFVLGKNANAAGAADGASPTLGTGISVTTNGSIRAVIDSSGGAGGTKPVLNIALSLPTVMTVVTGDIGVAAASGAAGSYKVVNNTTTGIGNAQIMASTSMTFNLSGSPLITLQYGNPTQGAMAVFSSLNISSIVFNSALSLTSPNGGAVGASSLSMTPSVTSMDLSGSTLGIATKANLNAAFTSLTVPLTAGGLLFQDSSLTIGTLQFNNMIAGTSGNSDATFGGSKNASLGSFGLTNLTVSNLKIGVSGM